MVMSGTRGTPFMTTPPSAHRTRPIRRGAIRRTDGTVMTLRDEPGAVGVPVVNRYRYSGVGGRISRKVTTQQAGSVAFAFRSDYTYTEDGHLKSITYPKCLSGGCCH